MKEVIYGLLVFMTISTHAQVSLLDLEIGGGYNHVINDIDLKGSATIHARIMMGYQLSDHLFMKSGIGVMDSEVTGLRDYSPLFGCDNRNGVADTLNSYYEFGNERSSILIPILLGYSFNRYEIALGIETMFNIRTDVRGYLIECGNDRVVSDYKGPKTTWEENDVNLALTLEIGIGLLKSQRLRLSPRIRYQVNQTAVCRTTDMREVYFELGIGYRLWKQV